ncbi:tRNA (adenosine(37)-N6)-threonylcarbamoyltransferase complex dimerization subunit type 1 TsaB [Salinibacillus xinjiangensis]|uniref:tRNA (Adenosine(37)-N6)-threonylcarbamoyltransferase complex dimerization subunit type 1 TsaB n=1 Tax=Salinibacillus xinjiangensis TaxID=1229268 RepID=A0A6G1X8S5_9BACI|nr:tRNA (adenosine(37)-N6)-threonylcarbamoyltransferase complex dimerization subunit type 1 TsaB [Salinibacillus xinjiangensis]MRG87342.1 tRNA (adenosine(37)-N6)-threonylcarbamoyltransferase complex dimerization subunit type 1 TsaB [Salinibacillus xinjiangensis]
MKVLAIDTSNQVMSVAVLNQQEVVVDYTTNVKKNHSVRLMPAIHTAMKEAGLTPSDLDLVAVAQGPGSFTGVRIGVTTAKTMAYSLNIPIVPVSSLNIAAFNGLPFEGKICSFFDARRGRVYAGLYQSNGEELEEVWDEENILFTDWLERLKELNEKVLFISNDVSLHRETIEEVLGEQALFSPPYLNVPRAAALGYVAQKKRAVDAHQVVPNYLRLAEAEAKWLEKNQEKQNHE